MLQEQQEQQHNCPLKISKKDCFQARVQQAPSKDRLYLKLGKEIAPQISQGVSQQMDKKKRKQSYHL